jgi:hypothetical protein
MRTFGVLVENLEDLRHAATWDGVISPRYNTWR